MNQPMLGQIINLGFNLLFAWLIWRYYRARTYPPAERYSTFWPRFWAGPVDQCVLWPIGIITTAVLSINLPRSAAALLVIMESLAWLLYTVLLHARFGQTIGKMVSKVRVVDYRTGGKISFLQAWLREGIPAVLSFGLLGYEVFGILTGRFSAGAIENGKADFGWGFWLLTALPGLWFLAEVLTMLTNDKRRALHDFIAGTVVVRVNAQEGGAQEGAAPNAGPADGPPVLVS